jgi:hypothetical protein
MGAMGGLKIYDATSLAPFDFSAVPLAVAGLYY